MHPLWTNVIQRLLTDVSGVGIAVYFVGDDGRRDLRLQVLGSRRWKDPRGFR